MLLQSERTDGKAVGQLLLVCLPGRAATLRVSFLSPARGLDCKALALAEALHDGRHRDRVWRRHRPVPRLASLASSLDPPRGARNLTTHNCNYVFAPPVLMDWTWPIARRSPLWRFMFEPIAKRSRHFTVYPWSLRHDTIPNKKNKTMRVILRSGDDV